MRVDCSCGAQAVVSRSERDSTDSNITNLYCSCTNPECGHTFVASLSFRHSLSFPASVPAGLSLQPYVEGKRIYCGCGERAIIQKTNRLSNTVSDLYCQCSGCGHRFVMCRAHAYTLSPSALTTNELAMALIRSVTPSVRQTLQQQLALF
ncbi:ogr/Delta-like zinc finger family protein [Enterovibrio nigricans]|uniref:Ogr/Delta-like zinc finger n=1 Tax=Enterovibrio nigricans DSM 22720 TaxID=1121868 RepID=A0A1T4UF58_9GAMM|nr:ogr/Delta-like zinc finger family protein [Enterovibrio nigricans]PKF51118.1 transcriptional regulator [Enterovibrio nigricans]SKA51230.1 Ogr/Delta-like zinc finger [Enterovibrio nigricans DSM 22720]